MKVFVWLVGLFFVITAPVFAVADPGTVVFRDDFETGLTKWQLARGNLSMWSITNGVLQGEVMNPNTITELVPLDSFWSIDWQNYELELDLKSVSGSDKNIAWGYQDINNWTEVHFIPTVAQFARRKNQTLVWYQDQSFSLTTGAWHHLKIRTSTGKLTMWVDGGQVFDFTEPNYDGNMGKIALKVGTGITAPARVQFDNVQVRLLADATEVLLPVPVFRQDDRNWAEALYDSAPQWAGSQPPTMHRWGCALTSAVMILRFYGFTTLLDGSPLTPLSLNSWLMAQVDGYVADGWVNWVALVRLARLLRVEWSSVEAPLPQLRYYYQGWHDWEAEGLPKILAELQAGRPSILELPHHFIVSTGAGANGQAVKVADPLSDKTALADFATPVSARLWEAETGSEVLNLSYWLIVFPKGLRIKLLTADGAMLTQWWLSQDQPGSDETVPDSKWQALTVPQPPPGEQLKLLVARATGDENLDGGQFPADEELPLYQPYELKFFQYDDQANPQTVTLQQQLGVSEQAWELNFETPELTVHSQLDWDYLIQELNQFEVDQRISPVVAARLRHIAVYARAYSEIEMSAAEHTQINQRYLTWFRNLFSQVQTYDATLISETATQYLQIWLGQY